MFLCRMAIEMASDQAPDQRREQRFGDQGWGERAGRSQMFRIVSLFFWVGLSGSSVSGHRCSTANLTDHSPEA